MLSCVQSESADFVWVSAAAVERLKAEGFAFDREFPRQVSGSKIEAHPQLCVLTSSQTGAGQHTLFFSRAWTASQILDALTTASDCEAGRIALGLAAEVPPLRSRLRLSVLSSPGADATSQPFVSPGTLEDLARDSDVTHLRVDLRHADGSWPPPSHFWWPAGSAPGPATEAWRSCIKAGDVIEVYDGALKNFVAARVTEVAGGKVRSRARDWTEVNDELTADIGDVFTIFTHTQPWRQLLRPGDGVEVAVSGLDATEPAKLLWCVGKVESIDHAKLPPEIVVLCLPEKRHLALSLEIDHMLAPVPTHCTAKNRAAVEQYDLPACTPPVANKTPRLLWKPSAVGVGPHVAASASSLAGQAAMARAFSSRSAPAAAASAHAQQPAFEKAESALTDLYHHSSRDAGFAPRADRKGLCGLDNLGNTWCVRGARGSYAALTCEFPYCPWHTLKGIPAPAPFPPPCALSAAVCAHRHHLTHHRNRLFLQLHEQHAAVHQ